MTMPVVTDMAIDLLSRGRKQWRGPTPQVTSKPPVPASMQRCQLP